MQQHCHDSNPVSHACTTYSQNEPEAAQLNGTNATMGYGATTHVANNPFAYAAAEQVQPQAQDSYMHGNMEERSY